jgi:phosphoglycolate phosphatase
MELYEAGKSECRLHASANELLNRLQAGGLEQAVLSAYPHGVLIEILRNYDLEKYFSGISGLEDIYAAGKIETGRALLKRLKWRDAVLIGDTAYDYEVAQALGIDCLLLSHGHNSKDRLLTCGVVVAESLFELEQLL